MRPLALLFGLAAVAAGMLMYSKRLQGRATGSTTNASDAVDDIDLPPNASHDEVLDAAVKETFPASDPVSPGRASETAYEKQQRLKERSVTPSA